jgi:hypothetical protein
MDGSRVGVLVLADFPVGAEGIGPAAALEGDFAAAAQSARAYKKQGCAQNPFPGRKKYPDAPFGQSKSHKPTLHYLQRGASTPIDVFIGGSWFRSFQ